MMAFTSNFERRMVLGFERISLKCFWWGRTSGWNRKICFSRSSVNSTAPYDDWNISIYTEYTDSPRILLPYHRRARQRNRSFLETHIQSTMWREEFFTIHLSSSPPVSKWSGAFLWEVLLYGRQRQHASLFLDGRKQNGSLWHDPVGNHFSWELR